MPKDILQNNMETIGAMISAAGTKEQIQLLYSLKDNMQILFDAQDAVDIEKFTDTMQKIISILEDPEFDLEFVKNEIRVMKLSLSEMTTKMLKVSVKKTKQILEENKVEEDVEETEDKPEDIKVESKEEAKETVKEEAKETGAADEAVKEENNDKENKNKEEENTMAKTVEELKEKLRKAKEAAAKCDSSTLAKVGKVSLGLAIVAGAAYGGYYYANNYSGRNTTIIINGGDED